MTRPKAYISGPTHGSRRYDDDPLESDTETLGTSTYEPFPHQHDWYHHAQNTLECQHIQKGQPQPVLPMNVFLTNKQICSEVRDAFYRSNTFSFCTCGRSSDEMAPADLTAPVTAALSLEHVALTGPGLTFITDLELHFTEEPTVWLG